MSVFDFLSLLGGLAMFLYGMRVMGDGLKESSSGTMKKAMEKVTNSPFKAFLLGLAVTALIQSSTATIVITSGLVAAGVISLHQSLGIIVGANVGTTVTGQIIRLLDLNAESASWLLIFKPSTLAPVALVLGIILIMGFHFKNAKTIGGIAVGFGILFSGLLTMTDAVSGLTDSAAFQNLFAGLGRSPLLGYVTGAGVAFILQSSSATIGILQAFAISGQLTFQGIYAVLVGIYLGDCVTTAIVCSIGAKADARRVGIVHILFNLSETVVVLVLVTAAHRLHLLDGIWAQPLTSGGIANTNTVFNLGCSVLLFPLLNTYERLARRLVRETPAPVSRYAEKLDALNTSLFSAPALALNACYDALLTMYQAARGNIDRAMDAVFAFDPALLREIQAEETELDRLADHVNRYLLQLSAHVTADLHVRILDQYYKVVVCFERLGDHAVNIAESAADLSANGGAYTESAQRELRVLREILTAILDHTRLAFEKRNVDAARHIEPLEECLDDLVDALKRKHLARLKAGQCELYAGNNFLHLLSDLERISDICSNVGIATLVRSQPDTVTSEHSYVSSLQQDSQFQAEYADARAHYFARLEESGAE